MVLLDWPPPDHLWIGRKSRQFLPSQRWQLDDPRKHPCRDPGTRPELRLPDAAAQTRIVSVARIRLDPGNLSDLSKGYFATTFLSSSPTTSATQWVSMYPFCLGLATTSARAALRLKAGRQPLCQRPSHAPHFCRAIFHSNVSRLRQSCLGRRPAP
jgi:hypothetical protein